MVIFFFDVDIDGIFPCFCDIIVQICHNYQWVVQTGKQHLIKTADCESRR